MIIHASIKAPNNTAGFDNATNTAIKAKRLRMAAMGTRINVSIR